MTGIYVMHGLHVNDTKNSSNMREVPLPGYDQQFNKML